MNEFENSIIDIEEFLRKQSSVTFEIPLDIAEYVTSSLGTRLYFNQYLEERSVGLDEISEIELREKYSFSLSKDYETQILCDVYRIFLDTSQVDDQNSTSITLSPEYLDYLNHLLGAKKEPSMGDMSGNATEIEGEGQERASMRNFFQQIDLTHATNSLKAYHALNKGYIQAGGKPMPGYKGHIA